MEIETEPTLTDEFEGLACIAALASPMTHEFNNFLNLVLLQVAVMQQQMPDGPREECFAHAERQSSDGRDDLETLGLQVVPERRGENSRRRRLLTLTRE